ncbi:MAG: TIGR01777 family oxidoreductase [Flavobacteriales bacterium]|nr:TIGR01777 family oxidoreductase [Flavobacteriales bacterium]
MAIVLITGGSGLIGRRLSMALLQMGHTVRWVGRRPSMVDEGRFHWDLARGSVDVAALADVDHIVHLAGAGIADERWTKDRIKELIDSRTESARLLLRTAQQQQIRVKSFVSAAGINYYGAVTSEHIHSEPDPAATDTIGRISLAWENAVDEWSPYTRVVKLRTPVVLSPEGGALAKLAAPVRWGLGAAFGSGEQWMPWVHLDDLVRIYTAVIFDDRTTGSYNVNTGADVTNDDFMRTVARVLDRPYFLPNVPAFALKAVLGDLASVLLKGSRASNRKLLDTGFTFRYPTLEAALCDLLK